jgi:crotonobetainyl-CoA:carnitine CoA-transferase CaiB-like acyl-CoA transferase
LPTDASPGPAIPLGRWADRQLRLLAAETGSPRIAALDGATLVGERAQRGQGFTIDGRASAGNGGSRLMATRDGGWFALTLIRPEDRELLPALFLGDEFDIADDAAIAAAAARHDCADLVARGRLLGLPCASADETPVSPPVAMLAEGPQRLRAPGHVPLVVDLSAIWAGPLAGHLLWLAGAEVVRVESANRPDLIRRDDPALFELINQGKASATIDFRDTAHRDALIALIRRADFVIESSRVRALKQLGIDAEALVRETPGLVWLSVTGHGATGEAAHWTGIGNDCSVAGGLARAMAQAGGAIGYVGDAVADPLTGITATREGWRAYQSGEAQRIALAMSAIVARALAEERAFDRTAIDAELRGWSEAKGRRFAHVPRRAVTAAVHPLGADTARYFPC